MKKLFLLISLSLLACSKPAEFSLENVVVREMAPGQTNAVAYLNIVNHGHKKLILNYAHSKRADTIEVHRHIYDNGVMSMRPVRHLSVAPEQNLQFSPGGFHLMLFGIAEPFKQGQEVELVFEFEGHEPVSVLAQVERR